MSNNIANIIAAAAMRDTENNKGLERFDFLMDSDAFVEFDNKHHQQSHSEQSQKLIIAMLNSFGVNAARVMNFDAITTELGFVFVQISFYPTFESAILNEVSGYPFSPDRPFSPGGYYSQHHDAHNFNDFGEEMENMLSDAVRRLEECRLKVTSKMETDIAAFEKETTNPVEN